jgi:hypothetical protein
VSLPYENATSGERAMEEINKILRTFGCSKVGNWIDVEAGKLTVQFEHKGRPVQVTASVNGYAAAWLKHNPHGYRMRHSRQEHERRAKEVARVAIYSILRDWIKGQVTAIETGILSFEGAFLSQIMLPSGRTVLEHAQDQKILQLQGPTP